MYTSWCNKNMFLIKKNNGGESFILIWLSFGKNYA